MRQMPQIGDDAMQREHWKCINAFGLIKESVMYIWQCVAYWIVANNCAETCLASGVIGIPVDRL